MAEGLENPLGEWNQLEITCRDDEVIVKVNGRLANHGVRFSERQGAIGLQSEGREHHFRNVRIRPED